MNMLPAKRYDFASYRDLVAAAAEGKLDLVLVGGQAVSYYGARYLAEQPSLENFAPFLSKDADLLGTVDDGYQLATLLKVRWEANPRKGGMQGLSLGKLKLAGPLNAPIELLGSILGAKAELVRTTAYQVEVPGCGRLKIINPFLLYCVKGINAVRLAQTEPDRERQDSRQFAVMSIVVQTILRRFSLDLTGEGARPLVKTCGRLLDFWLSEDGAALVAAGVVEPAKLLPMAAMRRHTEESVRNLVEKRWPIFSERQLPSAVAQVSQRVVEKLRADFEALLAPLHDALAAD